MAPAILLLYPGITGGLGFGAAFAFIPDITITLIGVCGLAIITGGVRITRLLRRDRDSPSEPASPTESARCARIPQGEERDRAARDPVSGRHDERTNPMTTRDIFDRSADLITPKRVFGDPLHHDGSTVFP